MKNLGARLLADSPAGNETFITDFYTQAFYGGAWTDTNGNGTVSVDTADDHYLWTANYSAAGHRFSFRVNFAVSNMSGIAPEGVQIRIPKRVLKDRTGAYADEYEMSVPTKADVDSGATVTQGGAERPMQYGDVAILLRSGNNIGGVYRRALAAHGVPVAAGQGGGFFVSVEISGMMSMLAVLDDPHQDIPLIAVLRSPAFGFSADELSRIRAADKTGDFFTALEEQAKTDAKCADFLALLEGLRGEPRQHRGAVFRQRAS